MNVSESEYLTGDVVILIPGAETEAIPATHPLLVDVAARTGTVVIPFLDTNAPWDDWQGVASLINTYATKGQRVHLVGCSMGGVTALNTIKSITSTERLNVYSVTTVDAPIYGTGGSQDAALGVLFLATFGIKGKLWSLSPFMQGIRKFANSLYMPFGRWTQIVNPYPSSNYWHGYEGRMPSPPVTIYTGPAIDHREFFTHPATIDAVVAAILAALPR